MHLCIHSTQGLVSCHRTWPPRPSVWPEHHAGALLGQRDPDARNIRGRAHRLDAEGRERVATLRVHIGLSRVWLQLEVDGIKNWKLILEVVIGDLIACG